MEDLLFDFIRVRLGSILGRWAVEAEGIAALLAFRQLILGHGLTTLTHQAGRFCLDLVNAC